MADFPGTSLACSTVIDCRTDFAVALNPEAGVKRLTDRCKPTLAKRPDVLRDLQLVEANRLVAWIILRTFDPTTEETSPSALPCSAESCDESPELS